MKQITYSILLLLFVSAISCKENVALEYENDPALYFVNEDYGQKDSLDHSFFLVPGDGPDTVYVQVQTMGYLVDKDRPILLEQTNSGDENAAVPGVHYMPFDDPEVSKYHVIPANSARASVPVILLRDESLDLKQVRLELKVAQNEHFRPGIPQWTTFVIKTTAEAVKPSNWDTRWRYYFGASWGSVKMKFIIDVTGYTDWGIVPSDSGYLNYLRTKVLSKFQEYNSANPENPLKEADGTLVSFTS